MVAAIGFQKNMAETKTQLTNVADWRNLFGEFERISRSQLRSLFTQLSQSSRFFSIA